MKFGGGYGILRSWTSSFETLNHRYKSGTSGECLKTTNPPSLVVFTDACFGPAAVVYPAGFTYFEVSCPFGTNWSVFTSGVGADRHRNRVNAVYLDCHVDSRTSVDLQGDKVAWGH